MAVLVRRQVGALNVVVHDSPDSLARQAALEAAEELRSAIAERGAASAMFATGNSQLAFVDALVGRAPDDHATGSARLPWDRVVVFHLDEYVGISPDHPASFQRWVRRRIVEPVRPLAAHYLDGTARPEHEAARYAELLGRHPLDLCCLGIGENGHLAFNDPPAADFDDPLDVKVVRLDRASRAQQVGEGHFPDLAAVPTHAVTVTVPALLRARQVLAVVPEARKASAVAACLGGAVRAACPATALRGHPAATLHLEPASAARLGWATG